MTHQKTSQQRIWEAWRKLRALEWAVFWQGLLRRHYRALDE